MSALLQIDGLGRRFGGVQAVEAVTLTVPAGAVYALIGPNGAGKSTMINMLTGLLRPSAGQIVFQGRDITGMPPHRVARAGIARTYQNGRLFARLSTRENVLCGGHHLLPSGVLSGVLRTPAHRIAEADLAARVEALLARLALTADAERPVTSLPYGRQRLVEIARALAAGPSLLLLDEPAAGLNSREAGGLVDILLELKGQGITTILIEHNMGLVMKVADRIAVLNFGRLIAEGTPADIRRDPAVLEAYLGRGYGDA